MQYGDYVNNQASSTPTPLSSASDDEEEEDEDEEAGLLLASHSLHLCLFQLSLFYSLSL